MTRTLFFLVLLLSLTLHVGCESTSSEPPDSSGRGSVDTGVVADMGSDSSLPTDAGRDAGDVIRDPDGGTDPDAGPAGEPAALFVENQTLATPFDRLEITAAKLAGASMEAGWVRAYYFGGPQDGVVMGSLSLNPGERLDNASMALDARVVGTHQAVARLLDASERPILGVDGEPATSEFTVVGDMEEPELFMADQLLDGLDLYALTLSSAFVPARYEQGVWVAIYEDDSGSPGTLRGKVRVPPGTHQDVALMLTSELDRSQKLHAIMREGRPGSGSWSSSSPAIFNLAGQMVASEFVVDSDVFRPVLEVEDQEITTTSTGTSRLSVKTVTIPEEYIGGGWVAIYDDAAGVAGSLIGKLYFPKGTRSDSTLSLTVPQSGQNTLHAKLHVGQRWDDAEGRVMLDSSGNEVSVTFRTGAQELNYILSPPHVTKDPRHVVVQRAYSYDKPAWVVLARDNNGQPGTVLARKKILPRFAGNVHIYDLYGDFLDSGTTAEYLTGQPGTFRRYVRGQENLHVLLYEDDPTDGQFTYTPGGSEDVPVVDSTGQPVVSRFEVTVASSVQNVQRDSPRYYAPCTLSQHVGNSTALPVDCRCHTNVIGLDFPECKATIANYLGMQFGDGPRAKTHGFGGFRSGFAEASTNSLVGLLVWKDATTVWPENDTTLDVGAVIRFDLDTRDRTVISGRYEDPVNGIVDVGTGPVLSYPFEVQKGPDGMYYVASYGYVRIGASLTPTVDVIKVDPVTGDREYVWRSNHLGFNENDEVNPYGHCANGRTTNYGYYSVQIGRKSFGIGPDNEFYFSYAHNGNTPTSDGIGIIKVSGDGSTCDFVTRSKVGADNVLYQGQSIGGGVEPQAGPYKGMLVKDGKLYVSTALDDDLYEVDIATGDRVAIHIEGVDDNNSGSSGTHVVWDHHRDLIWQAGLSGSTLLYDPATDTSEPLWCPDNYRDYKGISCHKLGAWGNNGLPMERGLWLHPNDAEYMFVVNGPMIQRVHLPSGTSEIFSY